MVPALALSLFSEATALLLQTCVLFIAYKVVLTRLHRSAVDPTILGDL